MSSLIYKFGSITIGVSSYGSKLVPRRVRSSRILAAWPDNQGGINKNTFSLTPGAVQFYFKHTVEINGENTTHIFAYIKWHKLVDESDQIGNPIQVWSSSYETPNCSVFMPVQRIHLHFATAEHTSGLVAVCPILRKSFF